MSELDRIFVRNRLWAEKLKEINPDYFENLSKLQAPEYLWIGCADSRVPANQIIDLPPGEVFVHRNIANVVVPSDLNCLSVLQYAVEVLKVKHIIVCGHYGCGAVKAADMGRRPSSGFWALRSKKGVLRNLKWNCPSQKSTTGSRW